MLNKFEVVQEFVNEGYLMPLDVAVGLMAEGFDISNMDGSLDGFSIEDLIDMKELYE